MSHVLSGLPWLTLRAFLPPGALLRFRTTARYWNDGNKFGPYGDFLIFLFKSGGEDKNTTCKKLCLCVFVGPTSDPRVEQHNLHESCAEW